MLLLSFYSQVLNVMRPPDLIIGVDAVSAVIHYIIIYHLYSYGRCCHLKLS